MQEPIDSWIWRGITYKSFFNLAKKPFDLLPNPDFLFLSKSHKRALSYLDYGISERVGFILLTGEVGSGKTTIIRGLIKKHINNVVLSRIFNTKVNSEQLIAMINEDFGLPVINKDKVTMLRELNDFLIEQYTNGNKPVLIIDEAQNLAPELLEEIRMLSNLETDHGKLVQIILVGQPELRSTLSSPALMQLRQRISVNCHLKPLTRSETQQYILHRLDKAGNRDAAVFPPETLDIIFRYSRGIPRLINIICDFLLLAAFADETNTINVEMVKDIVGDLDFEHYFWGNEPARTQIPTDRPFDQPRMEENQHSAVIDEMNERVENLAKESEGFRELLVKDMTAKLNVVERSLETYREETMSLLSRFHIDHPTPECLHKNESWRNKKNDLKNDSFLRRMFGRWSF